MSVLSIENLWCIEYQNSAWLEHNQKIFHPKHKVGPIYVIQETNEAEGRCKR